MMAGLHQENVVLRLGEPDRAKLAGEGGAPFEAMPGRRMREYMVLQPALSAEANGLQAWLACAFRFTPRCPRSRQGRQGRADDAWATARDRCLEQYRLRSNRRARSQTMKLPMVPPPRQAPCSVPTRCRGTAHPRGARRPGCWCRRRSASVPFTSDLAEPLPSTFHHAGLQASTLKLALRRRNARAGRPRSVITLCNPCSTTASSVNPSWSAISIVLFMAGMALDAGIHIMAATGP